MLANAIPIYCGAPNIHEHFDPQSFIHFNDNSALDIIKELDTNDDKYVQMLMHPWLSDNRLSQYFDNTYGRDFYTHVKRLMPSKPAVQAQPRKNINILKNRIVMQSKQRYTTL